MANVEDLKNRFKAFAIAIVKLTEKLPRTQAFFVYEKQLIRCSSSMFANFRAASRAKSTVDFIHKLKIVEEEADESIGFLELIAELDTNNNKEIIEALTTEGNELLAITVASIKTARKNIPSKN